MISSLKNGGGQPPRAAFAATGARMVLQSKTLPETRVTHGSQTIGFLAPNKKTRCCGFCYWGRLDSNQRSPKARDLQSLVIATIRHPQEEMLAKGLEPSTP